ncbi:glutaminyl-peptide cyclotransferase [Flavobacterium sp. HXWNR69]|uniref:Glutaminyl-peptide cyclotransferase n=1 Tax=Flavobacterium fragile TaxID=2949085 RepID=A0ABT0TGA6_9FLAO|nr:glutaminyl-peptide cyclotransferase [Flavobacterium sp. HXWNR69]MCL9770001.1 glutaminyl-peptide cyclotransferase [Flavobacterium sp. HXWNR69]
MFKVKLLAFISLGILSTSCKEDENALKNLFSLENSGIKPILKLENSIDLIVQNKENKVIDSVVYYLNDTKIGSVKGNEKLPFALNNQKLGNQIIKALVYFEGKNIDITSGFSIYASSEAKILNYKIVNTYPHDINAYTQGFEFYNGVLLEGTGQYKESTLRKTDYKTGKVTEQIKLEDKYFGEGITVLKDKIYQLTWQEKTGFVYDAKSLKLEKTFSFETEGWGITNDGEKLYMSDGSEKIYILNPETLKVEDYIGVYTNSSKIEQVNELEWVNGKIWANIYQKDAIAIINPKNGSIEAIINLSELKTKVTKHAELDVLNGIAYNPATKTYFVTGKNWDKTFEIAIE